MRQCLTVRIIGFLFLLVAFTLATDLMKHGVHAETFHKAGHIVLGLVMIVISWKATSWCKRVNVFNAVLFGVLALIGWLSPDLGGLEAFNRVDTALHSLVFLASAVTAIRGK